MSRKNHEQPTLEQIAHLTKMMAGLEVSRERLQYLLRSGILGDLFASPTLGTIDRMKFRHFFGVSGRYVFKAPRLTEQTNEEFEQLLKEAGLEWPGPVTLGLKTGKPYFVDSGQDQVFEDIELLTEMEREVVDWTIAVPTTTQELWNAWTCRELRPLTSSELIAFVREHKDGISSPLVALGTHFTPIGWNPYCGTRLAYDPGLEKLMFLSVGNSNAERDTFRFSPEYRFPVTPIIYK